MTDNCSLITVTFIADLVLPHGTSIRASNSTEIEKCLYCGLGICEIVIFVICHKQETQFSYTNILYASQPVVLTRIAAFCLLPSLSRRLLSSLTCIHILFLLHLV